ncbi:anti-sigma-F factor Fin family protein [Bacillaceae bacterium SIJ1]|uniref:anti-sigma-F factor Fin n=1 Tax=Litoribacterium kuwaitense TaxID=1398745 RepID=UPI0013ECD261|nr:anti-sigma-F factor Fin [Litoribacterium kuwaitense]NGP45804.1 anti-sigma-F factor Fin family protein [Litoribacterium kuwaitense]
MLIYQCRHCGVEIGRLPKTRDTVKRLGLHDLSLEEQTQMVVEHSGATHIKCICESCEEALVRIPEYHQMERFIQ